MSSTEIPIAQTEFNGNHALELLNKLNVERKSSSAYCDITIRGRERDFPVHKCIVGAFSDFFGKMFTSEMREKYEKSATVEGVSAEIMDLLIDFIYTCKIAITEENVLDILAAGDYMQIPNIKGYCSSFLCDNVNSKNCLRICKCAETYVFEDVYTKCLRIIKKNFYDITQQKEFNLLNVEDVSSLLQLKDRIVPSEEFVYNAVIDWVKYDFDSRTLHIKELLGLVNLNKLSKGFLESVVTSEELIMNSRECSAILMNALIYFVPETKNPTEIMTMGGENSLENVSKYDVEKKNLVELAEGARTLSVGCMGATAVNFDGHVYLIGGGGQYLKDIFSHVFRLSLTTPKTTWTMVSSMQKKRQFAASTVYQSYIYVIGGYIGDKTLSSGERYCTNCHKWTLIKDMHIARRHHGLVVLQGLIYAIGGYCSGLSLCIVECLNPVTGFWKPVSSMKEKRRGLAVVVLNEEIYAIGGSVNKTYLCSVERYNPGTDTWFNINPILVAREGAIACVLNGKIYVMGGKNAEGPITAIEIYDPLTGLWNIEAHSLKTPYYIAYSVV